VHTEREEEKREKEAGERDRETEKQRYSVLDWYDRGLTKPGLEIFERV
jgi:hypothetical protein